MFCRYQKDLETAIPLLVQVTPDDPAYASQAAAKALLARVYLYERNYDKAYEYASAVLAQNPIAAMNEYGALWTDESNKEVLFELKNFQEKRLSVLFSLVPTTVVLLNLLQN